MHPALTLAQPLSFIGREQPAIGVAVLTAPPTHLRRHDLVQFPAAPLLLVLRITGDRVVFGRAPVQKRRELGGVAYRRWRYQPLDDSGDAAEPPPPRRARPLVRRREAWPDVTVASGAAGVVVAQCFAEGSPV